MITLNTLEISQVTGAVQTHMVKTTQFWKDATVNEYANVYSACFGIIGFAIGAYGTGHPGAMLGLGIAGAFGGYQIGKASGTSYVNQFETDGTYEMLKPAQTVYVHAY